MDSKIAEILHGLEAVRHPVSSSKTLPPACYTDNDWYRIESEKVFASGWVSVGREDRWQAAGSYIAIDIAGVPIIIIRDSDGHLRALANSCSHRGMKLLSGEGECRAVVCPFHAWTYDLTGNLIAAPRMESCDGFDNKQHGLAEFRVGSQDGFVFVCLDPAQQELEDWLGDFSDVHYPWALEELVTTRVRDMLVDCNWKAFIEVFNEYYHLPYVHPDSLGGIYEEPDPTDAVMGEYTTQFGVTNGTAALLQDGKDNALPPASRIGGREITGTRYSWLYPNMTFASCFDSLWMYAVYPVGPNQCRAVQTICFPKASTERADFAERAEAYYQRIDTAVEEDLPFLEQQQIGLDSRFAKQGRFSTLEPSVGNFACWYADVMRGD